MIGYNLSRTGHRKPPTDSRILKNRKSGQKSNGKISPGHKDNPTDTYGREWNKAVEVCFAAGEDLSKLFDARDFR